MRLIPLYSKSVEFFNHKKVLDVMSYITDVIYHINWFSDIQPNLHQQNKSQLIIVSKSFFLLINYFIYLCLAALGLCCCAWAFSGCGKCGPLSSCDAYTCRCGGFSHCRAQARGASVQQLHCAVSVVVAHRLSCPAACGTFPIQGLNLCPLHWQADS